MHIHIHLNIKINWLHIRLTNLYKYTINKMQGIYIYKRSICLCTDRSRARWIKTDLGTDKPVPVKNIRAINATNQLPIVLSFYLHIHSKHLYSHTSFLLSLPLLSLFLTFIPLLYPTQYHMQLGIIFQKKKL